MGGLALRSAPFDPPAGGFFYALFSLLTQPSCSNSPRGAKPSGGPGGGKWGKYGERWLKKEKSGVKWGIMQAVTPDIRFSFI